MDQQPIPSLSAGVVGSRFITQDEIDAARQRREDQWKAAYARLGQEPPPQQQDDHYDGRSLAEIAKQEEWEEKNRLANQFRALEEDEIMFLDSVRERQAEEEKQRKLRDGEELKSFREAVAARNSAANNPPPPVINKPVVIAPPKPPATVKKDVKRPLKGVVVKKKAKSASSNPTGTSTTEPSQAAKKGSEDEAEPSPKRRKV
ncbi:N-terminal domain of NEFA-interacting nuclear protein NIP30 domain containing protein [Amanita muscaria]